MFQTFPSYDEVKELIAKTGDANQLIEDGTRLLHFACFKGAIDVASLLLDSGADIELPVQDGDAESATPLAIAIVSGKHDILALLLEKGARTDYILGLPIETTPLILAVSEGNTEAVSKMLSAGADPNFTDSSGCSPLHELALYDNCCELLELFLEAGANINAEDDENGWTPLHIACAHNSIAVATALISKSGINLGAEDFDGYTPLDLAIKYNHSEVAKIFEQCFKDSKDPLLKRLSTRSEDTVQKAGSLFADTQTSPEDSVFAILASNEGSLEPYLADEFNLESINSKGWTPLQIAVDNENISHVEELLNAGAKVDHVPKSHIMIDINRLSRNDGRPNSPLALACLRGNIELVKKLLEAGANYDFDECGHPPLHETCNGLLNPSRDLPAGFGRFGPKDSSNHKDILSLLLIAGADIYGHDREGLPVAAAAARARWLEGLQILKAHGADLKFRDHEGANLLLHAISRRKTNTKVVSYLISEGIDINQSNEEGIVPLHNATRFEDKPVIDLLLQHGADINKQDRLGRTPLHHGAKTWKLDGLILLIESGANLNLVDNNGASPLHIACEGAFPVQKVVKMLISYGADINLRNAAGQTPLGIALANKEDLFEPEFLDILIDAGAQE